MVSGFLFFAFGDMASEARMEQIDPLCDLMGVSKAPEQRFTFNTQGFANLKPDPGANAWGTLWMVPATAMEVLDRYAAERGLQRGVVFVISPAGPRVPATVYTNPGAEEGKPRPEVLAGAIEVATTLKFDRRFRKELSNWNS